MPLVLRVLCQGAMVAAPLLLLALMVPMEWEVDGVQMSYAELWASGNGAAMACFFVLTGFGAWGLAARVARSRWLLVFAPLIPYVVLEVYSQGSSLPSEPPTLDVLGSAFATAILLYVCLFRLPSVVAYLDRGAVAK